MCISKNIGYLVKNFHYLLNLRITKSGIKDSHYLISLQINFTDNFSFLIKIISLLSSPYNGFNVPPYTQIIVVLYPFFERYKSLSTEH